MRKEKTTKINSTKIYLIISFFLLLITILSKKMINDELIISHFSDLFSIEQIESYIESQKKREWLMFLFPPLIILIRSSLVAICLNIGLFFYDTENETKFKQLFRVALLGEFIFVLVGYFKFYYFVFIKTEYTLQNLQQFYPFSYTNFLDLNKIAPWLVYPLQTINLFEIGYFFVLVYGLHKLLKNKYAKSFEIVAVSYGTGLLIWLGLVSFLTLNIS
ncbi:hypothetical protein [Tenacibaculum aquimarinum]|uniref:hypothetical protein n=1 Tax=Tenacibaculum aquimarinum TaxID=2910675 RepID=UPI001F0B1055|nr:hypothetical protein [Tenacibaculum aquimarinum]MCH3883483.1 hypothetical protein [Tenacibaculum aquimarinum]